MQIHSSTVVQGGDGWNPETILPSVESLWSSLQDEVYFMGGNTA